MFKTMINGKEVKITFQHQRATYKGQLTRPDRMATREMVTIRKAVYAQCFCFFNSLCMGVAFCSYSDEKRYSKETGRQIALKDALKNTLRRSGKADSSVAAKRAQIWEDYFRTKIKKYVNPLLIERGIRRQTAALGRLNGMLTDIPTPMPLDRDETSIPWRLGGHSAMNGEVIGHLNELDAEEN